MKEGMIPRFHYNSTANERLNEAAGFNYENDRIGIALRGNKTTGLNTIYSNRFTGTILSSINPSTVASDDHHIGSSFISTVADAVVGTDVIDKNDINNNDKNTDDLALNVDYYYNYDNYIYDYNSRDSGSDLDAGGSGDNLNALLSPSMQWIVNRSYSAQKVSPLFVDDNNNYFNITNGSLDNNIGLSDYYNSAFNSVNDPDDGNMSFFGTYFSIERITIESVLAVLAIILNAASLGCITTGNNLRFSVYHTLFINLVIANILSSILSWISNNALFLFEEQLLTLILQGQGCTAFVYLSGAVFVQGSFGIISTLTLLGFSTAQYFAICKPLHHSTIVRRKKVIIFMVTSWIIAAAVCSCTYVTLILISYKKVCTPEFQTSIFSTINIGACIAIGICALIFCSVITLFLRIHMEIKSLQKRLSLIRFNQEVKSEKKAFITTVILMVTLVVVFLPYTVMYLVSLNHKETDMQNDALIYYMNFLPYFKFISDPIIYGFRMRDIRKVCIQLLVCCKCPCAPKLQQLVPAATSTGYTLHVRSTYRESTSAVYHQEGNQHRATPPDLLPVMHKHENNKPLMLNTETCK